jgi:hypothetical protein
MENAILPLLADFDIQQVAEKTYTESDILKLLSNQIAWMLEKQPETLFSLMYRLDVDEKKVRIALDPTNPSPPHESLALLVLNRQKLRLETKKSTQVDVIDPDLAW